MVEIGIEENESNLSEKEEKNKEEIVSDSVVTDINNYGTPEYDVIIGKSSSSEQFGILGKVVASAKTIALDLTETNTISLFGVQGGGKSYTIGSITEMVIKQFSNINKLPAPLAGVIFHYSESMDYEPEFTSMINPNNNSSELEKLKREYNATPASLSDVVILTPRAKVNERRNNFLRLIYTLSALTLMS